MATAPLSERTPFDAGNRRIDVLIVDDNETMAKMTAEFLARELDDATIRTLTDPTEAVAALSDDEYDCVVSDFDMPRVNGLELLERVRDAGFEIPFVLFTGKGSEEIASRAISAGVDEYLQKGGPEEYPVLANNVENLVEKHWAEQQVRRGFLAIESAEEGIGIIDENGVYQYVNEAYAAVYDRDRDELIGEHWDVLYPEEEAARFHDLILPELEDCGVWRGVATGVTKDGDPVPEQLVLTQMEDGGHVCIVQEIDREAGADSELRLKARALDEAPTGVVLTDPDQPDNPIVYANTRFLEMTGYDRAAVLGRNCRFLQGEHTSEAQVDKLREAIENVEPITLEIRNYRTDGVMFWNRVRIAPIRDDDGEVVLYAGFHEDVTRSRARQEQLRASRNHLEALFELSPDLVVVHDAAGTIVEANQRAQEELGYGPSELVGKNVWDVDATADPERSRSFWRELPPDTPRRFEGRLERADGSTFPVEVHLIRLDLDGEDRFVALDRDITEQKAREEELMRQNERLAEFSSVVSHDLRNPLQVAQGRFGLLADEAESEHLADLGSALDRMESLIDDLLTLAREGDAALEVEPVDVATVAAAAWGTVETGDAELTVTTDLRVNADPDQLQQLFENLFGNAIEHAAPDAVITVGDLPDGFYVADDGPGIPEDEREAVFDPGYSTSTDGTGFGLDIVATIAESHGWSVAATESGAGGARLEITGVES
ncbi:PAS domain S-box protein [Halolamina salifodinae]|uniref:histidine kinase n=1 Tax=Halolamina salifodinae TaxID=1202767 RepID=A0A8T4GTN6_9EURY|nr:PAS domain S-box protein [Halolamina salifodinae]MBP1986249.1 PAS domain S-box-containing protein [Halolamina salifodinae]